MVFPPSTSVLYPFTVAPLLCSSAAFCTAAGMSDFLIFFSWADAPIANKSASATTPINLSVACFILGNLLLCDLHSVVVQNQNLATAKERQGRKENLVLACSSFAS